MDKDISGPAETGDGILSFDVPDDVLERAAGAADGGAITWAYCTYAWHYCGWPL